MRYKYGIYKDEGYININSAKFHIEISSKYPYHIAIFKYKTDLLESEKVEVMDILFDEELKTVLLEAVQRILFYLESDLQRAQLGIRFGYNFDLSKLDITNRLKAILNDIEEKYNLNHEKYFIYDLENKDFVIRLLQYSYQIFLNLPEKLKLDDDVLQCLFKQHTHISSSIPIQKIIDQNKKALLFFLNGESSDVFTINKELVDDELIDLLFEKKIEIRKVG